MLRVRDGTSQDYDQIMAIYKFAQDYMIRSGNPDQWGRFYPAPELVKSDIQEGLCRVIFDEDGIHGVFAILEGEEPTYRHIEDGAWLNAEPYATIHRIAGDGRVHGLFRCAADYCKGIFSNVRIDTHKNNLVMQRQVEKNGFIKCGTIYVADGSPRTAYHWTSA